MVTDHGNTSRDGMADDFTNCGRNDCQAEGVVQSHMNQYRPDSPITLYILIGILCILGVISILVHYLLLPDIGSYYKNTKRNTEDEQNNRLNEIQSRKREENGDENANLEGELSSKNEVSLLKSQNENIQDRVPPFMYNISTSNKQILYRYIFFLISQFCAALPQPFFF